MTSARGLEPASVKTSSTPAATSPASTGLTSSRFAAPRLTRRQANRGPIPVNRTTRIASGVVYRLNHGAASEAFWPVNSSEISGKNVPQKITAARPTSSRLLTRKIASRESRDSIRLVERRSSSRERIKSVEPITTTAIRPSSGPPTVEAPNAWIDSRMPDRTRKVPSRARANVPQIKVTFHTLSIPRRSWTMIECRKAVPTSQGISEAFSTGSHPQ